MPRDVGLRSANRGDWAYIERLLTAADLPVPRRSTLELCYVCTVDGDRVGIGGIERYGTAGLLRSVAIEESARGRGYGTALTEALLDRARAEDIEDLFLLTTTAAGFFAEFGFEQVDRAAAPEPIRETTQFAEVCPDTATCMRRELTREDESP